MSQVSKPKIYLYGADHSPWTQAVMMFLKYKKLKLTLNMTADFKSIMHNKRNVSYFQMPVLHYNNEIISDSTKIMKFIHLKHPNPPLSSAEISSDDLIKLTRVFMHVLTRTKDRKMYFLYSMSLQKDVPTSYISLLFRPMIVLYFVIMASAGRLLMHKVSKTMFKKDIQREDPNGYYPKNTMIYGLKYFEKNKNNLYSMQKKFPSLLDFSLLGQFQSVYSGLSNECIPLFEQYFPSSKQWLLAMHNILSEYERMYSNNKVMKANYLEQTIFWISLVFGFPIHFVIVFFALLTRRFN